MDAMHARQPDAVGGARSKRGGYCDLSGWAKEMVDEYAAFKGSAYSHRASEEAKRYAPGFFVFAGLADSRGPQDVTADAIVKYVAHCDRRPKTKDPRLVHLRGVLSFMADSEIVPEWAALLAHERFACYSRCYGLVDGWGGEPGLPAEELLQMARQMVEEMRGMGYRQSATSVTAKALEMLYIALALNGEDYTAEKAGAWANSVGGAVGTQAPSFVRAVRLFEVFRTNGRVDPAAAFARGLDLLHDTPEWAKGGVLSFIELKRREGCRKQTEKCIARACARLAAWADSSGAGSWSDIDAEVVSEWSVKDPHATAMGRANYVSHARSFLEYLEEEGAVKPGVSIAARTGYAPSRKIVKVLTPEQVGRANGSRSAAATPLELRDAAIIALGLTMGLRACDVLALRLDAISWRESTLSIVQGKTGVPLTLPLSTAAGNALAAYIRNGRPDSSSPFVFVRHRAPHGPLTYIACYEAVRRTFGPGEAGFHDLRRTFATSMLRGGAGRGTVAEALGHTALKAVDAYLSLDSERMRLCALSPSECGIGGGRDA